MHSPDEGNGDHLCVLVHGLWGNPTHMKYIADALRARYDTSTLHILACERNAGTWTYDGIETGGERVAREIEDAIEDYARRGTEIKKLSIVGYSLGGMVSRYAIGLLYSKKYFDKITPVNFTTFVTPHLGVRTPLLGWHNHIWNVIAGRTLSASGRQLFLIDKFRNTDRPLLCLLADKDSVFYKGLARFENRALYANIVNDRATTYYTAAISKIDPFADLSAISINYLPKYSPIIVDPKNPVSPKPGEEKLPVTRRISKGTQGVANLPIALIYFFIMPVGIIIFLCNSVLQTVFSKRRIRLHLNDDHGYSTLPLFAQELQEAADQVFEGMNREMPVEHLPAGSEEQASGNSSNSENNYWLKVNASGSTNSSMLSASEKNMELMRNTSTFSDDPTTPLLEREDDTHVNAAPKDLEIASKSWKPMEFRTLALRSEQFEMIQNLDRLGFRKYAVHIHRDRHSHAAIIVRWQKGTRFNEGKVVVAHWLQEEFKV